MLYMLEFMLKHFVVKILITDSSGSMKDSKWPAVPLISLSMFENALTMFWNDFEMDLHASRFRWETLQTFQNAMEMFFNAMEKCYNAIFVKPAFPKEGHIFEAIRPSKVINNFVFVLV